MIGNTWVAHRTCWLCGNAMQDLHSCFAFTRPAATYPSCCVRLIPPCKSAFACQASPDRPSMQHAAAALTNLTDGGCCKIPAEISSSFAMVQDGSSPLLPL